MRKEVKKNKTMIINNDNNTFSACPKRIESSLAKNRVGKALTFPIVFSISSKLSQILRKNRKLNYKLN